MYSLVEYGDLYFVNESNDIIQSLRVEPYGYCQELSLESNEVYAYTNIEPNEAVLVQESVSIEDVKDWGYFDYTRGFYIYLKSDILGEVRIDPKITKKNVSEQILIDTYLKPMRGVLVG